VPGIRISEHLPKLAKLMHHIVPVRSMSTKEGDHGRATYLLRTGYLPVGPPIPVARPAPGQGIRRSPGGTAQRRQHRAVPLPQPHGLRPRFPRAAIRPPGRG
jgi:hypothetical protein